MKNTYKKVEGKLEVICTTAATSNFTYDYLINQRDAIVNSRDAELLEVDNLIAKCIELGVE